MARLPLAGLATVVALAVGLVVLLTGSSVAAGGEGRVTAAGRDSDPSRFELANRCWALRSAPSGRFAAASGDAYRTGPRDKADASAFYLKPTRPGAYLLYDEEGQLMAAADRRHAGRAERPAKIAQWAPSRASGRTFEVTSTADGRQLAYSQAGGDLAVVNADRPTPWTRFEFKPQHGCRRFPEAKAGAAGAPFKGTRADGTVKGFVDAHLHITTELRAGGRVIHGRSFARFGISRALGGDAKDHGPDGSLDVTGNLLRNGTPFGTHDTHGWPTFAGWPVHDTITHQQTYYVWLKRMWKAGLRLVVAQAVEDEPLCQLEPRRSHSCDEMHTVKLEIERLKKLRDYVDAQSGGPGRGWFRIVRSPAQARRVIERGKLAVLLGIESSNLFGCSQFMNDPECGRADIDRGIREYRRLGVRSVFVAHWVDNALAGAALEGGARGSFIGVMQALQTGEYFETGPCPEPGQGEELDALGLGVLKLLAEFFPDAEEILDIPIPEYPPGKRCNTKGLTELGRYAVRRLMDNGILIEMDHMSERARLDVLRIAEAREYPLVSSHTDTGGFWTDSDLRRLYTLGGFASATPAESPELAEKILRFRPDRDPGRYFGVGLGTDTGGFSELPGPRPDAGANPLDYPFRSHDGQVRFARERSGRRVFDLNTDGVAHYGLFADLLADMQRQPNGDPALSDLFRSAEAYLRTWRGAFRASGR